jgi:D-threo-aldose 1-dehydrogenase
LDIAYRVPLGRTSLTVSRAGLGSAPLAGLYRAVEAEAALELVRTAYARGIRLFDTAPLYGSGLGEERVGAGLRSEPRETYVLATKVGRLLRPPQAGGIDHAQFEGAPRLQPVFDFNYDGVMRSVEESLARLGLERIDILHIHDPDNHYAAAMDGAFKALDTLRREGTIGAVGAGMNQVSMLLRFAREAPFDCFLVAGRYTLLDQAAQSELLPECHRRGIGIILGGVFNSGILADPDVASPTFNYRPADAEWVARARRLKAVCDRREVSLKAAALQFPLAHPAVTSILLGPRSIDELDENLELLRRPLPAALWADLLGEGLLAPDTPVPG